MMEVPKNYNIPLNLSFFRTDFIRKFPKMHLPIQAMMCTACFGLALPASIALFPQIIEVHQLS